MSSSLENSDVLITGGAGFIGSHLVNELLTYGANVICIDNLSTGSYNNIKHLKTHENFALHIDNVCNSKLVDDFGTYKFDYVIHFASMASPILFEKWGVEIIDANVLGSKNMLEIARKTDAIYMFASSSEVYGYTTKENIPTKESYWGNVHSTGVRGCYDEGKRLSEAYAMAYKREYKLNVLLPRIFNTYGPQMATDGRAIPTFCNNLIRKLKLPIYGTGEQTRAFLYISDLIEGLTSLMISPRMNGVPVNLGQIKETTINELVEILQEISGIEADIKYLDAMPDDPMARLPDISLAQTELAWSPKIDLKTGLAATYNWFYNQNT